MTCAPLYSCLAIARLVYLKQASSRGRSKPRNKASTYLVSTLARGDPVNISSPSTDTAVQEKFWDEMNRREAWDRTFEKRMAKAKSEFLWNAEATEDLKAERAGEDDRRQQWDETQARLSQSITK